MHIRPVDPSDNALIVWVFSPDLGFFFFSNDEIGTSVTQAAFAYSLCIFFLENILNQTCSVEVFLRPLTFNKKEM